MQLQNTTGKERSSTVLRFASFLHSILKRAGGAVAVGTRVAPRHRVAGAVARPRLPQIVACGFSALRSSEVGSQRGG
jgi:hypothetical protein